MNKNCWNTPRSRMALCGNYDRSKDRRNEMTSEDGEMWNALKKQRQEKRASNRDNSAKILLNAGIPFIVKNDGAHLIVEGRTCFIDFWPGTGRWHSRDGTKGFGVRNLLEYVK